MTNVDNPLTLFHEQSKPVSIFSYPSKALAMNATAPPWASLRLVWKPLSWLLISEIAWTLSTLTLFSHPDCFDELERDSTAQDGHERFSAE